MCKSESHTRISHLKPLVAGNFSAQICYIHLVAAGRQSVMVRDPGPRPINFCYLGDLLLIADIAVSKT